MVFCLLLDGIGGYRHFFKTLQDISEQLRQEFDKSLANCASKTTQLCKKEKETWQLIDELEVNCKQLVEEVNAKSQQLVNNKMQSSACRSMSSILV